MTVCWVYGHAVIAMPAVNHALDLATGNRGHNGPWWLCVVGLAGCIFVHCGVVNNTPRTTVWFCGNDHPAAPTNRVIDWNLLKNTKLAVMVKAFLDIFLPVQWNLAWGVDCNRDSILFYKEAQRWGAVHEREWLVFTAVKCT